MPIYLRQSTASQEVPLGYFVDSTDGNTEETGLTIANTDIKIWKTGATTLANKNSGGATHISNGVYYAVLDATDTDTIGPLVIFCHPSGALATRVECCVLDEAVYDVMFGTTAISTYAGGDTSGVTTLLSRVGTPSDLGGGASLSANNTDMAGATFSSATDSQVALRNRGDAAWITATGFSTHSAADVWSVATRVLTANTNLNDPTAAAIANAVWDEALSGHLSAGSTGEALNAAGAAGDPWTTTLPGAYGAGSAGYIVGNNLNAPVGTVDTVVDAIKAVTDLLPDAGALSSLATAAALTTVDTVVDGIKAVTDNLPDSGALTTIGNNVTAILADTGTDGVVVAAASKTGYTLSATGSAALTEGYASLGSAGTLPELLYEVRALLAEKSISSTTLTTKKLDGSTTAATYTLDDATTPSSITRAT